MSPRKPSVNTDAFSCDPDGVSGSAIASVAKVIANPTCAQVLDALLSDRRLSVTAIATEIRAPRSTVSEAVGALASAGLVRRERQGRRTIAALASDDVADALEALGRLSRAPAPVGLRAVTRMQAMRRARTCYDHFAGVFGVGLADRLLSRRVLTLGPDGSWHLSETGRTRLVALGLDPAAISADGRRPLVRACADWTEHRDHVAGRLGAAICSFCLEAGLVRRLPAGRAVQVMPDAEAWLARL